MVENNNSRWCNQKTISLIGLAQSDCRTKPDLADKLMISMMFSQMMNLYRMIFKLLTKRDLIAWMGEIKMDSLIRTQEVKISYYLGTKTLRSWFLKRWADLKEDLPHMQMLSILLMSIKEMEVWTERTTIIPWLIGQELRQSLKIWLKWK